MSQKFEIILWIKSNDLAIQFFSIKLRIERPENSILEFIILGEQNQNKIREFYVRKKNNFRHLQALKIPKGM